MRNVDCQLALAHIFPVKESAAAAIMKRVGGSVNHQGPQVFAVKMAENDIDLYADDIDQDFAQVRY